MVVSSYQPAVTCFGSTGKATTVDQSLIDLIPTTAAIQVFGYVGAPNVEVILPKTFWQPYRSEVASRSGFYAQINVNNRLMSFDSRWFDVFAAVVSINTLCVRNSKAGIARLQGGLSVKVDRRYRPGSDSIDISGGGLNATDPIETT